MRGARSGKNADFVEKCGASVVVDYRQDGYIEKIAEHGPYDVVLDAVSSADAKTGRVLHRAREARRQRLMETGTTTSCLGEPRGTGRSPV